MLTKCAWTHDMKAVRCFLRKRSGIFTPSGQTDKRPMLRCLVKMRLGNDPERKVLNLFGSYDLLRDRSTAFARTCTRINTAGRPSLSSANNWSISRAWS